MNNDRIFVSTSYMDGSAAVVWAAASSGILSPDEEDNFSGEFTIHMDGRATIKWWEHKHERSDGTPYVLVIDPERRNGSYITVYVTEDEPPDSDAEVAWKSTDESSER